MLFHFSLEGMDKAALQFWEYVQQSKLFAFHGQMGSGKTTIITALCRSKGVKDVMGSPTYSIINEYTYIDVQVKKTIYHIDLYRLKDEAEVIHAGVEDCIVSGSVCMVEWPERAPGLFDSTTVHVYITIVSESQRTIEVKMPLPL